VSVTRREALRWAMGFGVGIAGAPTLATIARAGATPAPPVASSSAAGAAGTATRSSADALASARADLRILVEKRALKTDDPWVLMHAVLPLGPDARHGAEPVLDYVARNWIEMVPAGGKSYPHFPLNIEAHPNHFLQIMYERGVPPNRTLPIKGGATITRADLSAGAKALFTAATQGDELAWTVSVLSADLKPGSDRFENAEGRAFTVSALIEAELQAAEGGYGDTFAAMKGAKPYGRSALQTYACNGTHVVDGLLDALAHGYRDNQLLERTRNLIQAALFRLGPEVKLIDEAIGAAGTPQAKLNADAAKLQFLGHSLEMAAVARTRKIYEPTASEQAALHGAERELAAIAHRLTTSYDLDGLARQVPRAYRVILGDASHALHAVEPPLA